MDTTTAPNPTTTATEPPLINQTTAPVFNLFPTLPVELRNMIFRFAAQALPVRFIEINRSARQHLVNFSPTPTFSFQAAYSFPSYNQGVLKPLYTNFPSLLYVSRESRAALLTVARWCENKTFTSIHPVIFNPVHDILYWVSLKRPLEVAVAELAQDREAVRDLERLAFSCMGDKFDAVALARVLRLFPALREVRLVIEIQLVEWYETRADSLGIAGGQTWVLEMEEFAANHWVSPAETRDHVMWKAREALEDWMDGVVEAEKVMGDVWKAPKMKAVVVLTKDFMRPLDDWD